MLLILLGGVATAFNFIIILHKLRNGRIVDSLIDLGTAITIGAMFVGTLTGMAIGMMASAIISIYLWFFPIKFQINLFNNISKWLETIFKS